ncbi:MAG TPA: hypothetical protein VMH22_12920 [bacterium]|nr:hypothetical protein [bacterium]
MDVVLRRNAAVLGSIALLCSIALAGWTKLTSGTMDDLRGVSFPEGTQVGYAVGAPASSGGSVYKTTDGGATWVFQNPGTLMGLRAVFFKDDNNGVAVGDVGAIVMTTDGGATWMKPASPTYDPLTYVSFPSKSHTVWIGVLHTDSLASVLKSTDGGSSWTYHVVGGPLDRSTSAAFATDSQGVVVGVKGLVIGNSGYQNSGAPSATLAGAAFSPTNPDKGYLIGQDTVTGYGIVRYTATFGPIWDTVRCPYVAGGFHGICMPLDTLAFICGDSGFIGVTHSALEIWATKDRATTEPIYGLCFPHGGDTGYAVGGNGTILKTTDGGGPWVHGVAEEKAPASLPAGIRVLSNPCRQGIALHTGASVPITVFDATGRAVLSLTAVAGTKFLPVRRAGAYFVKSGAQTARAVVTD